MSYIDWTTHNPLKMLAPLRFQHGKRLSGNNPKSTGGFWQIEKRFDIDKKGGYAKVVRVMTSDPEKEPIGESFTLPYGMVCGFME